jgi:repressor LexA
MTNPELSIKAKEALRTIRNAVMHTGKVPSVRQVMTALKYKSPHSAMLIMQELREHGFLEKKPGGDLRFVKDLPSRDVARTVAIPLVGVVACGAPMLAEENIEAMIPVSTTLARPGSKYFLLRAAGDSMNKAGINDGDLAMVRQQSDAENGQAIVALIDDEATIKRYYRTNDVVILKPSSTNPKHQPIILSGDFRIQGVVVATLPNID